MQHVMHYLQGKTNKKVLDCLPSTEAIMSCGECKTKKGKQKKKRQKDVVDDKRTFWPWNVSQDSVKTKSSQQLKKRLVEFIEKKNHRRFLCV